jgi:hypothetical protein
MMQLDLGNKEQEILAWAVKSAISDLGHEIADTENQDMREDLKDRKAILMSILHRLGPMAAAS